MVEMFRHQPIKIKEKSPKIFGQRLKKLYYKILGTRLMNSPMWPPFPLVLFSCTRCSCKKASIIFIHLNMLLWNDRFGDEKKLPTIKNSPNITTKDFFVYVSSTKFKNILLMFNLKIRILYIFKISDLRHYKVALVITIKKSV